MGRTTGSRRSGAGARRHGDAEGAQHSDGADARYNDATGEPRWRGERLGLPEAGPGAAAPTGRRMIGFLLDITMSALVAALFTMPEYPGHWSLLVWALLSVVPVSMFGVTPGMALMGIWVARVDGSSMVGLWRAVVRCALTLLLIPAMVWNVDGRAWHDRLTGTLVLRR